jgi:hypothetical protein
VPAHEKKVKDSAMQAVYRWVVSPDAENSKACLDIGNTCPDKPAGMLCLSAFWAFGNLTPAGEQVIPTPAGLAANGISQTLLLASLAKGGTRKPKERYEQYFNIAVDVFTGKDTWANTVADKEAPHIKAEENFAQHAAEKPAVPAPEQSSEPPKMPKYTRWKI